MKKLVLKFLIFFLIVTGGRTYGQITSCAFILHDTSACLPVVLIATANEVSSAPISARMWYLTTCTGASVYTTTAGLNSNFSYVINTPGCYCLRLWSQNQNGDTCSYQKCNITVAANPVANFTFSPTEGCLPLTVSAHCNSSAGSGTIDSVVIDWGCYGQTFYNSCPTGPVNVTYSQPSCAPGVQSPSVIIKNSYGCYAEQSFPNLINLIPNPVADFSADVTTANCTNSPLLVHFTASYADPNITYTWYVNGTMVQSGTSRLLTYSFPVNNNCYDVKLVVSHPSGCTDSIIKAGYICVRTSPSITFTQNISNVCVNSAHPDSLILQNTSQGIPSLTWQLSSNPTQTFQTIHGARAAYLINTAGTYTITATGVYSPGCTNTVTQQVLVAQTRPVAGWTQSDSTGCKIPITVNFNAFQCTGCTYQWAFSQGTPSTSTSLNPAVTFNSFANCNVRLIEKAPDGCSDSVTVPDDVRLNRLRPLIISDHQGGCGPLCVTFKNATPLINTPGSIARSCWSFPGSSIQSSCTDSVFCFNQPGCYNVKLVTTTTTGCIDSVVVPNDICVANPPHNTISVTPGIVCYHDTVHVNVLGDTISFAVVNFGQGPQRVFTNMTFNYVYTDTGNFCIQVITYRDSCKGDSLNTCIRVNPPIANFKDSTTCRTGDTVFLNNTSKGATIYKWYFCTGDSSNLPNPFKTLPYCDTCKVTLVATNGITGCSDRKSLTINTACNSSSFTPLVAQGCAPLFVHYVNTSRTSTPGFVAWNWNVQPGGVLWTGPNVNVGNEVINHTFVTPGTYTIAMRNESAGGCIDTVYGSVTVCKLTANFTTNAGCFPAPFCFTDSSVDLSCGNLNWNWSFGDSLSSSLQNPCHAYAAPGSYIAKLIVSNSFGCKDSITKPVIISSPVNVNFTLDTFVCPGVQTCVRNSSTGVALVYNWTMPGATPPSSSDSTPCYAYATAGDYTAYLHLSSNNLCAVNDTFHVHVHSPVAGGYASSTYISCPNPPQLILFHDTSKYTDTLWHWDFGDSTFSNQQNASHIYLIPGVYVVTQTVTDRGGCTSTAIIDTVTVAGPYGSASYTPSAGICSCKDSITFKVNTSNAVNVILLYGCNSGFTQINPNPIGTDSIPTVDYVNVGYCFRDTCRTKIIVDDATGCQVFLPDLLVYVDSPQVKMSFNNYGVCYAGSICFYDSTTYKFAYPHSYTLSRLWDFGDGATDTSINPCHYYGAPGNYNVKLYVHSNLGCFDSVVNRTVIIPKFPIAGYYADTPFTCVNLPICFHDTSITDSSTAPAFWVWDFGDRVVDTVRTRSVCHVYTSSGLFRVKMCVFDSLGCSSCDSSSTIHVIDNPVANAGGNQVICYGAVAQLNGVGGTNYHWSPPGLFSDPNSPDPTVELFNDTVITFTVSNAFGCTNTDTISLTLARVFANFNIGHNYCLGENVCATDNSTGLHDSIISYWYTFGVHPVSGKNNCYIFTSPGNYNVTLVDIDNHGCMDTISKPILIFPSPVANFKISDTLICSNEQICLTDLSTANTQITNWLWNYGDNSGSSLSSPPCHVYSAPFAHHYNVSLIVTDQNNCSDSLGIIETVNAIPHADFDWETTCEDRPMALTGTSTAGDTTIKSCQWLLWLGAPNPVIDNNCQTSFLFPPGAHPVQLVVTDFNGCSDTIIQLVKTDSLTSLSLTPADTTVCLGTSIDYQVSGVFNHVNWKNDIWISDPHARLVTINPLGDVSYSVEVQNGVCTPVSDSFSIHVIQPIPIEVDATPQQIVLGLTSNITSRVSGRIDSITWTPDSSLNCRTCDNPIATPLQTTTYIATIYYTQNGVSCSNSAQVTIDVLNSCDNGIIYVPNTFTPNGDGLNDIFMIRGIAATKINYFRVLDRWGRAVFEAAGGVPNDPQWGWDGTDKQGKKLNPDVYVYTYEIQCVNGNIVTGQGNVTLVR